jgi:hypothetical protein
MKFPERPVINPSPAPNPKDKNDDELYLLFEIYLQMINWEKKNRKIK